MARLEDGEPGVRRQRPGARPDVGVLEVLGQGPGGRSADQLGSARGEHAGRDVGVVAAEAGAEVAGPGGEDHQRAVARERRPVAASVAGRPARSGGDGADVLARDVGHRHLGQGAAVLEALAEVERDLQGARRPADVRVLRVRRPGDARGQRDLRVARVDEDVRRAAVGVGHLGVEIRGAAAVGDGGAVGRDRRVERLAVARREHALAHADQVRVRRLARCPCCAGRRPCGCSCPPGAARRRSRTRSRSRPRRGSARLPRGRPTCRPRRSSGSRARSAARRAGARRRPRLSSRHGPARRSSRTPRRLRLR